MITPEYGKAYLDYPVDDFIFPDGSRLKVHDITHGVPEFMQDADLLVTDPPWNAGNLHSFYTKSGIVPDIDYPLFMDALFDAVRYISPKTAYVEIGKQHLADVIVGLRGIFKYVTFYNSSYYHKKDNLCYMVRASHNARAPKLDGMDEESIIEWVCRNEDYECIADPCMGQGLVALYSNTSGKRFAGTDINSRRLAVARKRVETGRK